MKKGIKIIALSVVALLILFVTSCRRDHCPGTGSIRTSHISVK